QQPLFQKSINQIMTPALPTSSTYTLSFWYWATNSATNLFVRMVNGTISAGPGSTATNINIFITPTNYVPAIFISAATNFLSPGAANQNTTNLPPFPPLWINE